MYSNRKMAYMNFYALSFSRDLSSWDVSNVKKMRFDYLFIFQATSFNAFWNILSVETGVYVCNVISFNQIIMVWSLLDVSSFCEIFYSGFFDGD